MTFPKGKSGNPNGRPPNPHALATAMRACLDGKYTAPGIKGKRTGKEIFAQIAVDAVVTGRLCFTVDDPETGERHTVCEKMEHKDWIVWAKEVLNRVDGRVPQDVGIDNRGGPILLAWPEEQEAND